MSRLAYDQVDELRELLVGKSVTKASPDRLLLSDGTKLRIIPNKGCGGCISGHYEIVQLNDCENIITNVQVEDSCKRADSQLPIRTYRLFVFAEHRKLNLAIVEGHDGNGYYGSGFWVEVEEEEE